MRVGRIVAISVVSLASVIVLGTAAIAVIVLASSRSAGRETSPPPEGQQTVSPNGDVVLVSQANGNSSFLYRNGTKQRLTPASSGIESEASFSHNGKLIVYSFASAPNAQSSIWVVDADGRNPHAITGSDEDALHPVFSPDDAKVFYASSGFTGHYSPVVRSGRHDWDIFSVPVQPDAGGTHSVPAQITHESFYDLRSLDIVSDKMDPSGKLLISTTGYPIGALLEERSTSVSGRNKIFQPHVKGEPQMGPSFGEARFIHKGMDVLFLAATNSSGGDYDYNVFSMSDVTGSEIRQLTHLTGMTTDLRVLPNGSATFTNNGTSYVLNIGDLSVKPL